MSDRPMEPPGVLSQGTPHDVRPFVPYIYVTTGVSLVATVWQMALGDSLRFGFTAGGGFQPAMVPAILAIIALVMTVAALLLGIHYVWRVAQNADMVAKPRWGMYSTWVGWGWLIPFVSVALPWIGLITVLQRLAGGVPWWFWAWWPAWLIASPPSAGPFLVSGMPVQVLLNVPFVSQTAWLVAGACWLRFVHITSRAEVVPVQGAAQPA